jgi:hypothetical protein
MGKGRKQLAMNHGIQVSIKRSIVDIWHAKHIDAVKPADQGN